VGHGSGPALFQRPAGLGAVERLDLALLVDGKDDGVRRRIDDRPIRSARVSAPSPRKKQSGVDCRSAGLVLLTTEWRRTPDTFDAQQHGCGRRRRSVVFGKQRVPLALDRLDLLEQKFELSSSRTI